MLIYSLIQEWWLSINLWWVFISLLWVKCVNTELTKPSWQDLILRAPSAGSERQQLYREFKNESYYHYYHNFAIYIKAKFIVGPLCNETNCFGLQPASFLTKD